VLLQPDPDWIESRNWVALRAFVNRFKGSSALYAWYLFDEPDHTGLPPNLLAQAYQVVKGEDAHPIAVVFMSGLCRFGASGINPGYAGSFDILMFDYYPFWAHDNSPDDLRRVGIVDQNCRDAAQSLHVPLILVLQGFGDGISEDGVTWRDPTPLELSWTLRKAEASHAMGVMFYADYAADPETRRNVNALLEMPPMNAGLSNVRGRP
jgi:hypothetical protein